VSEETLQDGGGVGEGNSAQASPCMSPALSRVASVDDLAEYQDFEFVDPSFTCATDQLLEFDADLSSKQQRSAKKKEHNAKLAYEKAKKVAAVAEQQAAAEAVVAARRQEEQRLVAEKEARERALREKQDEIRRVEDRIRARDGTGAGACLRPSRARRCRNIRFSTAPVARPSQHRSGPFLCAIGPSPCNLRRTSHRQPTD